LHFKPDEHKAKKSFSFGIPFSFWTFAKRKGNKDFQGSFCKKQPFCCLTKESENKLLVPFFCKKKDNIRFFLIGKKESKNSFTTAFFLKSSFQGARVFTTPEISAGALQALRSAGGRVFFRLFFYFFSSIPFRCGFLPAIQSSSLSVFTPCSY